ncbi:MAG TPA: TetR/AcrR family transcriptional regulator [Chloroflexota bacterium]|nr:TetR/AcrR family transcriptional regulator [Chloroflexota bacterium]
MTELAQSVNRSTNVVRRGRLLDATARLVARYGYDKTSVEEIAREAGVSKGAVYLHWPSKEALFDATLVRETLAFLDDFVARVEADPAGGTLAAIYRHGLEALAASPLLLALYTRDARTLGDYARRQDPAHYRRRMALGQAFVRRMQAAGLVRPELDPALTTYLMAIISFGVLSMSQLGAAVPLPPLASLGAALGDLVQRGFGDGVGSSADGKQAIRDLIEETKRVLLGAGAAPVWGAGDGD